MKDFEEELRSSFLAIKIRMIAVDIFNSWVASAKEDDAYKDINFARDEESIVDDILDVFAGAIASLNTENHSEERRILGWAGGFALGFAQGNLDSRWSNAFLFTRTQEYREVLVLKAISLYLDYDLVTTERIFRLYNHMLKDWGGVTDEVNFDKNVIYMEGREENWDSAINRFRGFSTNILGQEMMKMHLRHLDAFDGISSKVIFDNFEHTEIEELLEKLGINFRRSCK
ncbi:MAG: hypothetical protein GY754_15640 [bacterium]|nr:hypothetical protein [bacterium]